MNKMPKFGPEKSCFSLGLEEDFGRFQTTERGLIYVTHWIMNEMPEIESNKS